MPSLVTMIADAGLGHEEVGAGDADVGGEKLLAQDAARLGDKGLGRRQIARGVEVAMVRGGTRRLTSSWRADG